MKKKFQKISKIVFVAGIVSIIALVIILFANSVETETAIEASIDGVLGYLAMACMGVAFVTIIFAVINFVLAFVDGMKRNKKDFLKRFIVQFLVMVFIYIFLHHTSDVEKELDILEIVMRSLAMSVGILGGEYMIAPPKDEEEELHF